MKRILIIILFVHFVVGMAQSQDTTVIRVGAKHFNEGYILSEMIALILEDGGFTVERKFNLGGTAVSFEALRTGAIDIYPEYTGTIAAEILQADRTLDMQQAADILRTKFQLCISRPYGFNNTYALVLPVASADKLHVKTISDLKQHPELKIGLSFELLKRADGWINLAQHYSLSQKPTGLEHGLAYQAILENKIDITDAYSTDGEIKRYSLFVLEDDKKFFPDYQAVSFYTLSLPERARTLLDKLTGTINEETMQRLNSQALFEKKSHRTIAQEFLLTKNLIGKTKAVASDTDIAIILQKTWVHIQLTFLALFAAILLAVPLGILLYLYPLFSKAILYATGILQTIPSIALLALLIPLAGIGTIPAIIALFLYALLPILRNTVIGLFSVDPPLKNVALAIGLTRMQRLRLVEMPLAMPMILTGIRTAAVINVGTATLAAFIGAGGLGEFIVTGLALNNTSLILQGAIPSALLAITLELIFEGLEWILIPRHLRQRSL
ncbi:glycine betaine ABC transporter substrate-binding protein [Ohtaekwangia koreensis]|uniref:Osmoprotectant transport system permease protein n=1 Tax=Ohtaekwangia koreensis TaxID=688867 RepID=A0A1T5M777_9BACT|nr:glycine betaine ABC transporter substrate-binding protein [Ohtaekwangia koreensis]SKC84086.1 osmoprotectant transport system permease protein [Ohtaekwangia koreensis]